MSVPQSDPRPNVDWILNTWVPALRSGGFAQGTGYLHAQDTYCCLGVACELLRRDGMLPEWERMTGTRSHPEPFEILGSGTYLPVAVADELGMSIYGRVRAGQSVVVGGMPYENLAAANDNGCTFAEIADALVAACEAVR